MKLRKYLWTKNGTRLPVRENYVDLLAKNDNGIIFINAYLWTAYKKDNDLKGLFSLLEH